MLKYRNFGMTIEIGLPRECGYDGYSVRCSYYFDRKREKYSLSMWLCREDISDTFRIDSQEVDTQYITSTRDRIKGDICRIVEQAVLSGYFDRYVERFEYAYACADRGEDLFDAEKYGHKIPVRAD